MTDNDKISGACKKAESLFYSLLSINIGTFHINPLTSASYIFTGFDIEAFDKSPYITFVNMIFTGGINVALGKPAYQTDTFGDRVAQNVVDGGLSQLAYEKSCTHTKGAKNKLVGRLRADFFSSPALRSTIEWTAVHSNKSLVGFHPGAVGSKVTFPFNPPIHGRWVEVTRNPPVSMMHFCDVHVEGDILPPIASPRIGRAKVLPISSARSSTAPPTLRTETATFLEVTPMDISLPTYSDHRRQIRQESKYKMAPATELPVEPRNIEIAVEKVLSDNLHDKYYEASQSRHLSQLLSARVLEEVRRQAPGNYKFVAVVSIGSVRERPGVQLGSRCLWNKDTDRFITAKYSNRSLFAVAMVYGLHYD
ncbi:TC1D1-like protein [Mya arenaria]|uniref:TC1D1-like protein n=1 Tax=Mya arenaria TaxID=6604 RepID=A0ABY7G8X6_MYAAR|nr:TC1D1-like protein [Mya arenaria]